MLDYTLLVGTRIGGSGKPEPASPPHRPREDGGARPSPLRTELVLLRADSIAAVFAVSQANGDV